MWLLVVVNLLGKIGAVFVARLTPVTAFALWFGTDALLGYHVFAPQAQGLVRLHRRFSTGQREVWLTIDDGPDPEDTPRILTLLAAHHARASPRIPPAIRVTAIGCVLERLHSQGYRCVVPRPEQLAV